MNIKNRLSETIVAITTGIDGAVSIIRVSGDRSLEIMNKIFKPLKKGNFKPRYMYYGSIIDDKTIIEKGLAVYFKNPNSFTGEDIVEFHIHGGFINSQKVLKLILKSGAIQAQKGEFTERAFLFGKIDLIQAESILEIIESRGELGLSQAVNQLRGVLSNHINSINKELLEITTITEATIDFPEEDYDFMAEYNIKERVENILDNLEKLSNSYFEGKLLSQGANVVIVGAPNVGKSSLMNILLNEERAIVTNIPGTTRDYLEGSLSIKGVPITLVDTAGIRESKDEIEQIGVERVFQKIENSDLIIFLIDETHKKDGRINFSEKIKEIYNRFKDKKHILIQNKSDIEKLELKEVDLKISTKNGIGIEELKELIYNNLVGENFKSSEIMITNNRHKVNIDNAISYMQNSLDAIENMLPLEFVSQDLKFALNQLGAILGEVTPDDILGNIFGNFCIGK